MKYDKNSIEKRKIKIEKISKLLYILIIILIYNIVLLSISYIDNVNLPNIFGYKAYSITTNSMSPILNRGDIIIIQKQEEHKIMQGDIITYKQNGEIITHRIIEIEEQDNQRQYITKGDNNTLEDTERVKYDQIEGVEILKIPLLGNILFFLKDEIIVLIIVLIMLIFYFCKIVQTEKKEERRKKKEIEDRKFKQKENSDL